MGNEGSTAGGKGIDHHVLNRDRRGTNFLSKGGGEGGTEGLVVDIL